MKSAVDEHPKWPDKDKGSIYLRRETDRELRIRCAKAWGPLRDAGRVTDNSDLFKAIQVASGVELDEAAAAMDITRRIVEDWSDG